MICCCNISRMQAILRGGRPISRFKERGSGSVRAAQQEQECRVNIEGKGNKFMSSLPVGRKRGRVERIFVLETSKETRRCRKVNIPTAFNASRPSSSSTESLLSDAQHPTDMASHGLLFSFTIVVCFVSARLAGTTNPFRTTSSETSQGLKCSQEQQ